MSPVDWVITIGVCAWVLAGMLYLSSEGSLREILSLALWVVRPELMRRRRRAELLAEGQRWADWWYERTYCPQDIGEHSWDERLRVYGCKVCGTCGYQLRSTAMSEDEIERKLETWRRVRCGSERRPLLPRADKRRSRRLHVP